MIDLFEPRVRKLPGKTKIHVMKDDGRVNGRFNDLPPEERAEALRIYKAFVRKKTRQTPFNVSPLPALLQALSVGGSLFIDEHTPSAVKGVVYRMHCKSELFFSVKREGFGVRVTRVK